MMSNIDITPDLKQLKGYTQLRQALADQLRLVRLGLSALGRDEAVRATEELMVRLAEDRFVLAVVGQFKRGKSSLMNAILGQEILPTGVLPLTAAITVLRYGPKPLMTVMRSGLSFPDPRPLSELADYVTEQGNPGNTRKVLMVRVELPVAFLRYGIEFVDTPGIGSARAANTETTYRFLPECDAVLFVTAADAPMTSGEIGFLKDLQPYVSRLFFVINKIDLLSAAEQKEVREYVARVVEDTTGDPKVRVFEISSKDGLNARLSKDAALYERSGLKTLEEELGAFLSKEKAALLLKGIIRRAIGIVDKEHDQNVFGEEALQARKAEMARQKYLTLQQEPAVAADIVMQARTKLALLVEHIDKGLPEERERESKSILAEIRSPDEHQEQSAEIRGEISGNNEDTQIVLGERGCPVCGVMKKHATDFLIHWQYELSTLAGAQEHFADEGGFCPLHSWQLAAISSPYGASVGYARLADTLAARLRETEMQNGQQVSLLVRNKHTCRVCEILQEAEMRAVARLAESLKEEAGRNEYARSQGACLRHLGMLITAVDDQELRLFLLAHGSERFAQDAEDMRSYALKRDALKRELQNSDEIDAYHRMMERLAGDPGVMTPWPEDGEI